jgi:hypothetical protein
MNQLTPEKDWVAKVNENFTKLSADVQRSTAFVFLVKGVSNESSIYVGC